jgi:hypothetical protein
VAHRITDFAARLLLGFSAVLIITEAAIVSNQLHSVSHSFHSALFPHHFDHRKQAWPDRLARQCGTCRVREQANFHAFFFRDFAQQCFNAVVREILQRSERRYQLRNSHGGVFHPQF